jgi:outer membrane protein assembly factor BamB
MTRLLPLCGLALLLAACGPSSRDVPAAEPTDAKPKPFDWPQWQGPDRNAVSKETGLLKDWPKDGPPLLWKATGLGGGFSTPSVAAGRIFGMSYRNGEEGVWALDEANGKELWWTRIADAVKLDHGEGSRGTPTVDGDHLYALGANGDLVCLSTASGKEVWHKKLTDKEFGGGRPGWGYSESPLIDGDKLICTPGGKTATLVALNKTTGEVIWKAAVPQGDGAQYSSVVVAEVGGKRQYVQFLRGGVVGVSAEDGSFLWRYDHPHNGTANCSTPVVSGSLVFAASGYSTGGGAADMAKVSGSGKEARAAEVFFTKKMQNHHGGLVLVDGYVYGSNEGSVTCLELKTGTIKWEERKPGKGSIICADGQLYYRNEGGDMVLFEVNPERYVEHGRFKQPDRSRSPAWAHPVLANGKLYLRDQDVLLCYDVKAK